MFSRSRAPQKLNYWLAAIMALLPLAYFGATSFRASADAGRNNLNIKNKIAHPNPALAPMAAMMAMQTATTYSCLPTCVENDSKMLILAGQGLATFVGSEVKFSVLSRNSSPTLELGIFDGDAGGKFDSGSLPLKFELIADPDADGNGSKVVASWTSATLTDGAWFSATINNDPDAMSGAVYSYLLKISAISPPTSQVQNAFKVRADGLIGSISNQAQIISLMAPGTTLNDLLAVYPNWPNLNGPSYDGVWTFDIVVPEGAQRLEIWDGDFDIGGYLYLPGVLQQATPLQADPSNQDTDDADTPNAIPSFVTGTGAVPERAAGLGSPADDNSIYVRRTIPSTDPAHDLAGLKYQLGQSGLRYRLIAPNGQEFVNNNPSGTEEWEQFLITSEQGFTDQGPSRNADYVVPSLTPGNWRVIIEGLDMQNLISLRFSNQIVPPTVRIGDRVWSDVNSDGDDEGGTESGFQNVLVELLDATSAVIGTTSTNATGYYYFNVPPGATYTTRVAASNFGTGGPLEGRTSTVNYGGANGGNQRTQPVGITDLLTYDYGYAITNVTIGDRVWSDVNSDGDDENGTENGFLNVTVELLNAANTVIGTTQTNAAGYYFFTVPTNATYTTRVAASNFAVGAVLQGWTATVNYGGTNGGNQRTQAVGTTNLLTYDYGYVATGTGSGSGQIGSHVFIDSNNDGIFAQGNEQGIDGVTVELTFPNGQKISAITADGGEYLFTNLPAGTYIVTVVNSTIPAGYTKTITPTLPTDPNLLDHLSKPTPYTVVLPDGGDIPYADFGYVAPPTGKIGDYVWQDADLDGIQDSNEKPIANVTVRLKKPDGTIVTAVTNSSGNYLFTGLTAGTYQVDVDESTLPAGMVATTPQAGSNTDVDSNFDPSTVILATNSSVNLSIDFGYVFRKELCPPGGTTAGSGGTLLWGIDNNGDVTVRYSQPRNINDNAYGSTATVVGWNNHKFDHLYRSDQATFEFKNAGGSVVLKFAMDYLSYVGVKPGIPSGYASEGPNGGDGQMYTGSSSNVLSYDSSMAQNLNKLGFCTNGSCTFAGVNLFSNSPATDNKYDPTNEVFDTWNFTNFYQVKISKSAFGSSGFGSVRIADIHNSPAKTGSEAYAPGDCVPPTTEVCKLKVKCVTVNDCSKQYQLTIKNEGTADVIINSLNLSWPSSNGKLLKVKLDNNIIYSSSGLSSPATLVSGNLTSDTSKRKVPKGGTRVLIFEFEKYASKNESSYSGWVKYGTNCQMNFGSSTTNTFTCSTPIDVLKMAWDGSINDVYVTAWKGEIGKSTKLKDKVKVTKGQILTVSGYAGSTGYVYWEIYKKTGYNCYEKIGVSKFYLSCTDADMNGPEDCGKRQGNGHNNYSGYLNDWLFRGLVDSNQTLSCPIP